MDNPKQLIISISREFGSGGRDTADLLAKRYNIPVYEKNILQNLGLPRTQDVEDLYYCDESPRWKLTSRTVRGFTNSNEAALAAMEFDFLQKEAKAGKSFIVMGHCSEEVLKEYPGLVTIFISSDIPDKVKRICRKEGITEEEAYNKMKRHDRKRKSYHNSYCPHKWGDSRYYELCIRTSELGVEETADFIADYIERKFRQD